MIRVEITYQYGVPTNEFAGDFIEAEPKSAIKKKKERKKKFMLWYHLNGIN